MVEINQGTLSSRDFNIFGGDEVRFVILIRDKESNNRGGKKVQAVDKCRCAFVGKCQNGIKRQIGIV